MFCAIQNTFHHGAHGEHGEHGGKELLPSVLRALRDFRGEAGLRFTKLDLALRHLTLLDMIRGFEKRTHRAMGTDITEAHVTFCKYAKRSHRADSRRKCWPDGALLQ